MKTFNKISAALLALPLMASFTACEEEANYIAANPEQGAKVFFATSNPANVSLAHETGSTFDVLLSRSEAAEAVSVPVTITCSKPEVFSFPAQASFAAGSAEAAITFSYDGLQLDYEEKVDFNLSIDEAFQSLYGISNLSFSAMIPAPWVSAGMATYVDDFVTAMFGVDNVKYEVEIQANQVVPGLYRLVNPYGEAYPYNEPGDYDESQDYYLEIHAEDPDKVWIPVTEQGVDWTYGNFLIGSLAGYYLDKGKPEEAEEYYGKLEDGVITFPANSLLFGMADYNDGGLYTANGSGAFVVAMPGVVLADYSVKVAYAGKFYDVDDNLYVTAEVTAMGPDVEEVRLAVTEAENADALLSAIVEGLTEDYVSLSAPGKANLPMPAEAQSGKYTILAVAYGAGEAQEANAATFKYTSMSGEPAESWTAYYVGTATYNCLFEEPESDEEVMLLVSDDDPTEERCKVAPWLDSEEGMIFSWPEEGNVLVLPDQELVVEGDYLLVSDIAAPCSLTGGTATWYEVIMDQLSQYADGTESQPSVFDGSSAFYFNVIYYSAKGSIYGWGFDTFQATAAAGARARRCAPAFDMAQPAYTSHVNWFDQPKHLKSLTRQIKSNLKSIVK